VGIPPNQPDLSWCPGGSCRICVPECESARSSHADLFLHYEDSGDEVKFTLGDAQAWLVCVLSYYKRSDGRSQLTSLTTVEPYCNNFNGRLLVNMHLRISASLGATQLSAMDAAHFAPNCEGTHFSPKVLKGLTTGQTLYQRYYGDKAFSFSWSGCTDYMKRLHSLTSLKPQAEKVLKLTQQAAKSSKACRKAEDEYDALQQQIQQNAPGLLNDIPLCGVFNVKVSEVELCK